MIRFGIVALALAACVAEDPGTNPPPHPIDLFDPTGTWVMVGTFTAGNCNATGTFKQNIIVVEANEKFLASTGVAGETTGGTVSRGEHSGTLDIVVHSNTNGALGAASYSVTAVESSQITGMGSIALTGALTCTQSYTIMGNLQ